MVIRRLALAQELGDTPPSEFLVFRQGPNPSRKGTVLFDEAAAASVMAAYEAHGADVMIDLEHLSLEKGKPGYDPDARGWAKLEVRDGELWAVNVRWTPDGQARVADKRQRYISPAFLVDSQDRVTSLLNIALTGLPATDQPAPLIAASLTTRSIMPEEILAALGLPPDATPDQVLAAVQALQAQAQPPASTPPAPGMAASAAPAPVAPVAPVLRSEDLDLALEVRRLSLEVEAGKKERLVRDNRDKFTPALEAWAMSQTLETVQKFLAAAPDQPKPSGANPAERGVTLSAEDLAMCNSFGADPEQLKAYRLKKGAA